MNTRVSIRGLLVGGGLLLAPLLGTALVFNQPSAEAPNPEPAPAQDAPDPWAGKPVMDAQHVQGMVNGRLRNAPMLGEPAPDFRLVDLASREPVSLSDLYRDKPVVLFFGSYSCPITQDSSAAVLDQAERYGSVAHFVMISIREAHPEGGFSGSKEGANFSIEPPADFAARCAAAKRFAGENKLKIPILVDAMNDSAAVRWAGWPVRLFVIGTDGKVKYSGQQGPWFHRPTADYDPKLPQTPEPMRNLPGYSRESLEEFLERLSRTDPPAEDKPTRESGAG